MASIQERKNKNSVRYYVMYRHNNHQYSEKFTDKSEAEKRKSVIEYEQQKGIFVPPSTTDDGNHD